LKRQIENKRFINVAFSVLVATAIAYLLNLFVTGVPIEDSARWIFYSLLSVLSAVGLICYIFESAPSDMISGLKILLIVFSTMAIFGFSRFFHFYNELQTSEVAAVDSLGLNYYTFIVFFISDGIILFLHGLYELKSKSFVKGSLFIFASFIICIIAGAFIIFEPLSSLVGGGS